MKTTKTSGDSAVAWITYCLSILVMVIGVQTALRATATPAVNQWAVIAACIVCTPGMVMALRACEWLLTTDDVLQLVSRRCAVAYRSAEKDGIASAVPASVPEPPPVDQGTFVTPVLLSWLHAKRDLDPETVAATENVIRARDAFGYDKYGTHLRTGNGRDFEEDAVQELGDAMQYAFGGKLNGASMARVKLMLPALAALVQEL